MQAGKLRNRVTINTIAESRNARGQVVPTPTKLCDRWAAIEPLAGSEVIHGQQLKGNVTHLITIRYTDGITPRMQIIKGTRVFNIDSVLNVDERKKSMELACSEVV